jgi:hypothetical protein
MHQRRGKGEGRTGGEGDRIVRVGTGSEKFLCADRDRSPPGLYPLGRQGALARAVFRSGWPNVHCVTLNTVTLLFFSTKNYSKID